MGELQSCIPHQNGGTADFNPQPPPPPSPGRHHLDHWPSEVSEESWRLAGKATEEVIETIQATPMSEKRRQQVIEYVQRLIRGCLGCEVFPYGSVPLKTYLPDGDIDLTALGMHNSEDVLANNVRCVLETEEKNKDAFFEVKDVQYIHAEVKLVKCLVQNIVVDISFNQSGGLPTLCFLELVDNMIGKDHLFKRSIILIKAWCYYESRILGAHHGLISTYALETLILFIFHLYNSSLNCPLAVLYRFLHYYSKFDWDNFCISLYGPIPVSTLPELVAEAPQNDGDDLLFSKEFLKNCVENFWLMPRGSESTSRKFPQKFLNIVDPLRENNNLGRSVSRGNFYRIRSAFTYGARKLERILLLPHESLADEVRLFFANTLDRHGCEERPDVQGAFPGFPESTFVYKNAFDSQPSEPHAFNANGELSEGINNMSLSHTEKVSESMLDSNGPAERRRSTDDARFCTTSKFSNCDNLNEKSKDPVSSDEKISPTGKACHVLQPLLHSDNGYDGGSSQSSSSNLIAGKSIPSIRPFPSSEEVSVYLSESKSSTSSSTSWFSTRGSVALSCTSEQLDNSHPGDFSTERGEVNGSIGSSKNNKLADLTGDYGIHLRNLLYVQWSQECIPGPVFPYFPQSPPYQYRNKNSWGPPRQHGSFAHMNSNGILPGLQLSSSGSYPTHFMSGAYCMEDPRKPRGTGTYFPNTNYRAYKERHSPGRGKTPVSPNYFRRNQYNGRGEMPQNADLQDNDGNEPPTQLQLPAISVKGHGKPVMADVSNSTRPSFKETTPVNDLMLPPDAKLEFGSFGHVPSETPSSDANRRLDYSSPRSLGSQQVYPVPTAQRFPMSSDRERSTQGYQLKDEGDFPPLTG